MLAPVVRVVQGRIQVLIWSVTLSRSDWITTTGLRFPGSVPWRGFKSADHSSPRRGELSGIAETIGYHTVKFAHFLYSRGLNARSRFDELSAQFFACKRLLE